ncbi:MAG: PepSY domain-containing protein [Saprospiraceae bacterium]|nr:PepSY domain-containing protein [Saprospiraceae bacterium]MCF8252217.1 PepSY domain-containing protein [Saprospiraceae bacterium]MCF8282015.1 PepSY domain-containing protein [Bacteroidales bacterium]MCF8311673.1 PepSY domain-containing protein [Saprospiraceae bacterium]MCF8442592.1 PepSY domain-containing protein [Saprospiraceae bacterium]
MHHKTEQLARKTRSYRRIHRFVAVPLFAFMFIIGLTGVLLGWKKQFGLKPSTQQGVNPDATFWIPIDSLQRIAIGYVKDSLHLDPLIDRIDIRPDKAIAKVAFVHHYTELQLDCGTGKVLSSESRLHDFVEHVHDGTIMDRLLGTKNEQAKISYTTITSISLMLLAFSGFWMWLNPRRMRKLKSGNES